MNEEIVTLNALQGNIKEFDELLGRCLYRATASDDEMKLYLTPSHYVKFYHDQSCCESVYIEDVCGDLEDLVGSPLLVAEEVSGYTGPELDYESYTWTFYRFGTRRGSVTVRWLGTSNGYYSESVQVEVINE